MYPFLEEQPLDVQQAVNEALLTMVSLPTYVEEHNEDEEYEEDEEWEESEEEPSDPIILLCERATDGVPFEIRELCTVENQVCSIYILDDKFVVLDKSGQVLLYEM